MLEETVNTFRAAKETVGKLTEEQKERIKFIEFQKRQKQEMETAKQEQLVHEMEMQKLEKEEMVKRNKMTSKLVEILMSKGMNRIQAIEVARGMVKTIRELKLQNELPQNQYDALLKDERKLVTIAEASLKTVNNSRATQMIKSGMKTKEEIIGEIVQNAIKPQN